MHRHHVIPESWTAALGEPEGPTIIICPTGHDAIHVLIRKTVLHEPMTAHEKHALAHYVLWVEEAVTFWLNNPSLAGHRWLPEEVGG